MSENTDRIKAFEFRFREPLGRPECPYLLRTMLNIFGYSIRLHEWSGSDDQRSYHDHPFDFITIVLSGAYIDISPDMRYADRRETYDILSLGAIRYREAEHIHKVKLLTKKCTTLFLTGRPRRKFGFYIPGREKLMRPFRYFSRYGHHPCEVKDAS